MNHGIEITDSWTSAMFQCVCGGVFQASGTPEDVGAKQEVWMAQHTDCTEPKREGTRVFWLSFCDAERPVGEQFLGACLVEVSAADADEAAIDVLLRFPLAEPDAEWIAAALRKAHRLGCNPGGEVASMEVPAEHPNLSRYQLGVLMDKATIERIEQSLELPEEP